MSKSKTSDIGFTLRQLLQDGTIGTHEGICKQLKKMGFSVSQSKVSRLLHKLGVVKVTDQNGQNIYRLPHKQGLIHELNMPSTKFPLKQSIISIDHNRMLIVIHTIPGAAALVAREIDLHHLDLGILGSLAGDDTIFIVPKDVKKIQQIMLKIQELLT